MSGCFANMSHTIRKSRRVLAGFAFTAAVAASVGGLSMSAGVGPGAGTSGLTADSASSVSSAGAAPNVIGWD